MKTKQEIAEECVIAITDGPIVTENITIDQRYVFEKRIKELEEDLMIQKAITVAEMKSNASLKAKLKIAVEAFEKIAAACGHLEEIDELCECSTQMTIDAQKALTKIKGEEK